MASYKFTVEFARQVSMNLRIARIDFPHLAPRHRLIAQFRRELDANPSLRGTYRLDRAVINSKSEHYWVTVHYAGESEGAARDALEGILIATREYYDLNGNFTVL